MFNFQKGITPIISIIIIIAVIAGAIVAWQYLETKKQVSPTAGEQKGKELVGEEEEQFADWKTYRNEDLGFELKYPQIWIMEVKNNPPKPVDCLQRLYFRRVAGSADIDVLVFSNSSKLSLKDWIDRDGVEGPYENYVFNEISAFKSDQENVSSYFIFVARGNYVFMFDIVKSDEQTTIVHNQILSTFKFIE